MTLQELQKQVLQLPIRERWQLVQAVLTSLQEETRLEKKPKNLSRLRATQLVFYFESMTLL